MRVELTGERRAIAVLRAFDRGAFDAVDKGLKEAGEVLRDEVRANTPTDAPLSGWGRWKAQRISKLGVSSTRDLSFNGSKVRAGIKVITGQPKTTSGGGEFVVAVATMSPAGGIYALSGSAMKRAKSESSYRGRAFGENLARKKGRKFARGLNEAANNRPVVARAVAQVEERIRDAEQRADRLLGGNR